VVAAASYEARKFGVRSAMSSVSPAQVPGAMFVSPRFDVYRACRSSPNHLRTLHVAYYSEAVTSQAIIEQLALSFFSLISRRHGPESRFRTAK